MTKIWHSIKSDEIENNDKIQTAANQTLTLTVDKNGNFIYTDMGDELTWKTFCKRAGI